MDQNTPEAAPRKRGTKTEAPVKDFTVKQRKSEERKTYIFVIEKGAGIYLSLPQNSITVYDESTNSVRSIRYCPNEPSIYTDEQSSNALREHIVFREGLLAVPYTKPNLVNYLTSHPSNTTNGGTLFHLMNEEAKAEIEVDMEFKIYEAVGLVRDKQIEDLLPVALFLGIDVNQESMGIKRELLREAKSNPDGFVKMFDNPQVKTRSAVMQGVDFQILRNSSEGMYWFDSNRLIVSTPAGMDSIDVMTRFCLTEKGAPVYEQILARLNDIA